MMKLINKTYHYLKNKGLILTLLKIWDYIIYKLKIRKIKFTPVKVNQGNLGIISIPKGVNLECKDKNLTTNVGLHISIKCIEKLHDSTQADWEFRRNTQGLIVKQRWWNLPLSHIWYITVHPNKIIWTITMEIENVLILDEIKVGILIKSDYNKVKIDDNIYSFPEAKNWELLGIWENKNSLIFLTAQNYPEIRFRILESLYPVSLIAQNTDEYLNGRLVQMGFLKTLEFPAGRYGLAKLEVEILP